MKRLLYSVLALGLIAVTGCPSDDDDDAPDHEAEAGAGGKGGTGGRATSTAGKGGSGGVTADQAAIGMCEMMGQVPMGGAAATPMCTGLDEYSTCVSEKCGADECYETRCKALIDCIGKAADPCKSDCTPSSDCTACLTEATACASEECLSLIMCGMTEAGGACDDLDDCCDTKSGSAQSTCQQAASAARSGGGDDLCENLLSSLCPD
jgi:hypothetical protein